MRTADEINTDIENKNIEIEEKQEEIDNFEIDADDKEEQFNDLLDKTNEGIFNMLPSDILRKCAPIMYRQELLNYVDSLQVSDEQEYKDLEEELETLNTELEELEEELEEAEENE